MANDRFQSLCDAVAQFRDERDWRKFHQPKALAAAISIEAAELQEIFVDFGRAER